jgi:hypothetical protein
VTKFDKKRIISAKKILFFDSAIVDGNFPAMTEYAKE